MYPKNKTEETDCDSGISFEEALKFSRHKQFENKMHNLTRLNKSFNVVKDDKGFITNVIEVDNENTVEEVKDNEVWFGVEINEKVKLPMPTHCLKDKKYCAKEFGALMVLSNKSIGEGHRYLYRNKIDPSELAKDLGISKLTLERNIKKLEKLDYNVLDIENSNEGIIYKLHYGEIDKDGTVNKFVTVNHFMLKELVCSFNNNAIKLYCVLKYSAKEQTFTTITEAWLCDQIGLSCESGKNQSTVRTLIKSLEKCKFLETKKTTVFRWDIERKKQVPQVSKQYRLCTYEEWKGLDNKVD